MLVGDITQGMFWRGKALQEDDTAHPSIPHQFCVCIYEDQKWAKTGIFERTNPKTETIFKHQHPPICSQRGKALQEGDTAHPSIPRQLIWAISKDRPLKTPTLE